MDVQIVTSYAVLVVGIALIGWLWAFIGGSGKRRTVVRLTTTFVVWGLVCYTMQLLVSGSGQG